MASLSDTRDQARITYPRQFLSWMGLMVFLLKVGSRRQIRFELNTPEALENLNRLAGCQMKKLAHSDTLNHFLGHVPPGELPKIRRKMVHRLIRMKALDKGRLLGSFLIAIDGTGQFYFRKRHCEHCLVKTVNGKEQYYHHVLEAKLVTPEGLAISVGSEFIENTEPGAGKQDCELKAFQRLAPQLKKDFPQLQICLCLDGLYANRVALSICREYRWKYFITFKEGSLPTVWKEYQSLKELTPDNSTTHTTDDGKGQAFRWVNDLNYVDDQGREQRFNVLECQETTGKTTTRFVWLTNFKLADHNVVQLANRGGRCRWKIENEGFNIQKNGGFNLEHAYSRGSWQIKNFYVLMQIAHMILQLLERGSLLSTDCKRLFGSLRNLTRRFAESIRNRLIPLAALRPSAIQIRLDTS